MADALGADLAATDGVAGGEAACPAPERSLCAPLQSLMLCRIASSTGATRNDLCRDLNPITSHRLSPSELRQGVDDGLDSLIAKDLVAVQRLRMMLTEAGRAATIDFLRCKTLPQVWNEMRDTRLTAVALGMTKVSERRIDMLSRPDGLRVAILQSAYGIPGKRQPSFARLRSALALIALERAFGNKIKSGFAAGKSLSANAGRSLAGQLARRPRDFGTDNRLIAALAAEACGALQTDTATLRTAVLRNHFSRQLGEMASVSRRPSGATEVLLSEGEQSVTEDELTGAHPSVPNERPDLQGFASVVVAAAKHRGHGWGDTQKAFVCQVWEEVSRSNPEWCINEVQFKAMLVEAHRTGHIKLATADLRSKSHARELHQSAITYKNTVWHYVRVA
ncbi:MAG: hypothetical protein ACR2PG_01505 [Hyphomicrobiaceae bacterium]